MRDKTYVITITLYKLSSCLMKDDTFEDVGTYLKLFENNKPIVQYFCIRLGCQMLKPRHARCTSRKDAIQNGRRPNCNYWNPVWIHKLHYFLRLNNIPVGPFSWRFITPAAKHPIRETIKPIHRMNLES